MNHDFQKSHEEDAIAIILDVMEEHGWDMVNQYNSFYRSEKNFSMSETQRDVFVFHKPPRSSGGRQSSGRHSVGLEENTSSVANIRFE